MNGASYVVQSLAAEGVDHLFMVPGGMNDPFMPAMTETPGVRTVVAAHEAGAAYMADGYARASGRLGVAFGIGGPGIFNMVTALAAARADRSRVTCDQWRGADRSRGARGISGRERRRPRRRFRAPARHRRKPLR